MKSLFFSVSVYNLYCSFRMLRRHKVSYHVTTSEFPCSSKGNQPDNSWETCPWLSRIMTNLSRVRRVTPLLHTIMSSTSFPFASSSCCPLASRLLFHNSCLRGRPLPMSPLLICFGVFPAVFCRLCAQQRLPFSILSCIAQCLSLIPILLLFLLKKKNISPLP